MRNLLKFISICGALFITSFGLANAQVSGQFWLLSAGTLKPVNTAWTMTLPYLGGSGTRCVQVDNNGLFAVAAAGCAGGGGGSWPFTPTTYNSVAVQATSTGLWLQATSPFSLIASSTFATNASSTQLTNTGSTWLTSLGGSGAGCVSVTNAGLLGFTSCGGGSWPFTPSTYNGVAVQATSTGLWLTATSPFSLIASSTFATNASSTQLTNTGSTWLTSLTSGVIESNASGLLYREATSSASAAGALVVRDANQNAFSQNFVSAGTSFPTNGGTVTLTNASPRTWVFTGTNSQTMKLPSGTTLSVGAMYTANNNASGVVTVVDNGNNVLATVPFGGKTEFVINDVSTTNGTWDAHPLLGHGNVSGTNVTGLGTTTPIFMLTVASSTGPQLALTGTGLNTWTFRESSGTLYVATSTNAATSSVSAFSINPNGIPFFPSLGTSGAVSVGAGGALSAGTLSIANGGTNATACATTNGVWYYDGTRFVCAANMTFNGSVGQLLTVTNASTTNATFSSSLQVPTGSNPSPTVSGYVAQSTNAPYQLQTGTAAGTTNVYDVRRAPSFSYSTTTTWTGTTTAFESTIVIPFAGTYTDMYCNVQPSGATLNAQLQYANASAYTTVNLAMVPASTTPGLWHFTANNTPTAGATSTMSFGTPSGSPTHINCTPIFTISGV